MCAAKLSLDLVEDLCSRYSHQKANGVPKIISYSVQRSSDTPIGYLGRHEVLSVQIQQGPLNSPKEVTFFIKSAPSDVASRAEYIEEIGVFQKEISVYRDVLPKLQKAVPEFAARCYFAKDDILVFEHLGEMGFKMGADRSGLLDFEHLNCALKSLASLHAASIIFEAKNHQKIPRVFPKAVKENAYPVEYVCKPRLENFDKGTATLCELIKVMPEYQDSDRLEFILKEFRQRMKMIFELSQTSKKYFNVFSHGDLWANNVLFKYEEGRPVESRLVDFQLTRYAPPILDVITWLSIQTSRAFRAENLNKLLDNYYFMMTELLQQNGLQLEDFIPHKEFEESVAEFMLCGVIESCLFSHMTVLPTDLTHKFTTNTEDFDDFFSKKRNEICLLAFNTDELYRRRMTDMISDIIDNYILV